MQLAAAAASLAWRGVSRARQRSRPFSLSVSLSLFVFALLTRKKQKHRLQTMRNFIRNPNTDNDLIYNLFVVKRKINLINVSTEKAKG